MLHSLSSTNVGRLREFEIQIETIRGFERVLCEIFNVNGRQF